MSDSTKKIVAGESVSGLGKLEEVAQAMAKGEPAPTTPRPTPPPQPSPRSILGDLAGINIRAPTIPMDMYERYESGEYSYGRRWDPTDPGFVRDCMRMRGSTLDIDLRNLLRDMPRTIEGEAMRIIEMVMNQARGMRMTESVMRDIARHIASQMQVLAEEFRRYGHGLDDRNHWFDPGMYVKPPSRVSMDFRDLDLLAADGPRPEKPWALIRFGNAMEYVTMAYTEQMLRLSQYLAPFMGGIAKVLRFIECEPQLRALGAAMTAVTDASLRTSERRLWLLEID